MQKFLRTIGVLGILMSIIWFIWEPNFNTLIGILAALVTFLGSLVVPAPEKETESVILRNRHKMLDHVENFWIKGFLESSLHGATILKLGLEEDIDAVNSPLLINRRLKREYSLDGKSMLEIFQEVGMGRSLLLLGEPGSGKTTLLLELTRQLIEYARKDETMPIPIVLNISSWQEKQTLSDWLAEQLNLIYLIPKKIAPAWINENQMTLLLDGLDEVQTKSREKCIETINQFGKEYGLTSLVICSRAEEYYTSIKKLSLVGAIRLQPLRMKQINHYLDSFGKNFIGLKKLLKKDRALLELAETPLMLSIMTHIYHDAKPQLIKTLQKNIEDKRRNILNTYINRMFEYSNRTTNSNFTKEESLHYLSWLAKRMIENNLSNYQIESIQPSWLNGNVQRFQFQLYVLLSGGVIFGLYAGLISSLLVNTIESKVYSFLTGFLLFILLINKENDKIAFTDTLSWSWKAAQNPTLLATIGGVLGGILVGTLGGLVIKLIGVTLSGLLWGVLIDQTKGMIYAIGIGLLVGAFVGVIGGLTAEEIEETSRPAQRLRGSMMNIILIIALFTIFFSLLGGLVGSLIYVMFNDLGIVKVLEIPFGLVVTSGFNAGMSLGLTIGLISSLASGSIGVIRHWILRFLLRRYKLLPLRLNRFLNYAVELAIMRRVGGSYIFVHRLLMEHVSQMNKHY